MLRRNGRLSSTAKFILRAIAVSMLLNGLWSIPHPCKALAADLTVFNVGILATPAALSPFGWASLPVYGLSAASGFKTFL